jgi:hypothetical protein
MAQPGQHYFNVEVDATCDCNYSITAWGWADANASITVNYSFTVTSGGVDYQVKGQLLTNADQFGSFKVTVSGLALPGGCKGDSTFSNGFASLTESTGPDEVSGIQFGLPECNQPPPGKTFDIGPSSMEGHLLIRPGDWVSGGYSFKFNNGSHPASTVTVSSTLTMPFKCADGTAGSFVINLGTQNISVPAGNTDWQPTGDANSVLSWAGSGQAPAGCGPGNVMDNSKGGVFEATVQQNPDNGSLLNWRFKYRDPNAKGKGNVNCLDTTDPRRAKADVCGASWSQTVTDP